jgi:hypothetical protein
LAFQHFVDQGFKSGTHDQFIGHARSSLSSKHDQSC